jgi:hypothetical protein
VIRWSLAAALSLHVVQARAALTSEAASVLTAAEAPVVEIRVSGDAAALERVRVTAGELLSRLSVRASVKSIDEPETSSPPRPIIVAYLDLRAPSSPSIDVEDGRTNQELIRRHLTDVTTLETGVESLVHVLYLTVEAALQVAAPPPPAPPTPAPAVPQKPAPAAQRRDPRTPFGFDVGPMLRVASLGSSRIVPGGGLMLEPRAAFGGSQLGISFSAALHASTELAFARGEATVRPIQLRVVPTLDRLLSSDVSGCVGLGAGLDSLFVEPLQAPDGGTIQEPQTALDPMLSGVIGARMPISGRAFLSALASLDYDLAPTSFVAREGGLSRPILQLPRLRGGFTLALSFTAAGARRFETSRTE